jgi:hypothetical protein
MPPEVLEGVLMGLQKRAELLIGIACVEGTAAVAQGEHKEGLLHAAMPEVDTRLTPVDLALQPRWGLKAGQRPLRLQASCPQRAHEELHRLVAAPIVIAAGELLVAYSARI